MTSKEKESIVKRYFADTSNEELADMIGMSESFVKKAARRNRLYKSEAYIRQVKLESIAHARYVARKTGFAKIKESRRRHTALYERLESYGERYVSGEDSLLLASEVGMNRNQFVSVLNRYGYYKYKKVV